MKQLLALYFHLRDGRDVLLDAEGRELESQEAVAAAALREARAIIAADAIAGRINLNPRIDVEDEHNHIVHRLLFVDAVELSVP